MRIRLTWALTELLLSQRARAIAALVMPRATWINTSRSRDGPPPAAAPPSGVPELAATGPGVTRLALSGLLTLLVGTGLVLIARQRPNGPGSRRT
ncbi:hypothetical protein [Lentzea terrae]|uniref:hypothetical protein n=1 Tax=Lentzea terrae TaxID=2200761 RepID=UPI001E620E84|nr:hypothetical protein [Lentzea terrae]